ncbi:MAG: hypothetical protein P0S96_05715 [Simkaniaceae bacterium]|nr:hypothetical protein [Candidatus Sacchlamyda saccharinae]
MKINQKILSIPPYVSTAWKNVVSLHLDLGTLVIGLVNGSTIEIPGLDKGTLESTFAAHQNFLEKDDQTLDGPIPSTIIPPGMVPGMMDDSSSIMSLPLRFGMDANMGNILQHNPEAADSPDLPKEMLDKVASFSKVIGFDNSDNFPKPEPHCNCMHCQIMKAMQEKAQKTIDETIEEEEVSEEDLRFREWDIRQESKDLYVISNPLNAEEHYNVFLGKPVGCTCGQDNCEHIRAVLNS